MGDERADQATRGSSFFFLLMLHIYMSYSRKNSSINVYYIKDLNVVTGAMKHTAIYTQYIEYNNGLCCVWFNLMYDIRKCLLYNTTLYVYTEMLWASNLFRKTPFIVLCYAVHPHIVYITCPIYVWVEACHSRLLRRI